MKFTKMHGIGNDYVYVNCFENEVKDPAALSIQVSDRHFGVGSDGLILIKPSEIADCRMEIYNADGSQAEMCGNGIRCVGKYVYDYGLTDKSEIDVDTLAGIKHLVFDIADQTQENPRGQVRSVTVNMGSPALKPADIPAKIPENLDSIIDYPATVDGKGYRITCVSVGNPHCIVFVDDVANFPLEKIGPSFESNELFPQRTNTEFVEIIDRKNVNMRVWERGSAETMACGTGSCATAVACILNGYTDDEITVHLLGGDLNIRWDRESNLIYMTGPACAVFNGELI